MQPSRNKMSSVPAALLAVILIVVLSACGNNGNETNGTDEAVTGDAQKIIAVYQGGQVNEQEFNRYYYVDKYFYETMHNYYEQNNQSGFREQMLQNYISFKILSGRAEDEIRSTTESEVDERMTLFDQELENYEEARLNWQAKSGQWGINKEDVKQYILIQATALNHIRSQVTDERVQTLYNTSLEEDPHAFTIATVRHVLVAFEPEEGDVRTNEEALARAQEVKQLLDDGGDFAEIVKEYSDDPGSKNNGGRYVSVMVNDWVQPFKEAVIELPYDTISEPVETDYGYHVIMVEERHEQTLEEARSLLEGQAVNEIYTAFLNEELPTLIEEIDLPVSEDQSESGVSDQPESETNDQP